MGRTAGAATRLDHPDAAWRLGVWDCPEPHIYWQFDRVLKDSWRDGFREARAERRRDMELIVAEHEKRLHGDSESVVETRVATDYEVTLTFDPEFIDERKPRKKDGKS